MNRRAASSAPEPAPSNDVFLTPQELSQLLKIPSKTLATWRHQRTGPVFVRVGIHVRYATSDLNRWLTERRLEGERWMES